MSRKRTLAELTALFRNLGIREPESWAQTESDTRQLASLIFLSHAWSSIPPDGQGAEGWPDQPNEPFGGIGQAIKALRAKGASDEELTEIIRGVQASMLHDICYLLEGPRYPDHDAPDVNWGLFEIDEAGKPLRQMDGLHELVLFMDPTGREMRPKHTSS